ncbi:DUF3450 domain-containing protein [Desulfobacter hydrogenophilus]|nr:DUF3450 domain-containing protein [Desulfobacter hydrogenophilus]
MPQKMSPFLSAGLAALLFFTPCAAIAAASVTGEIRTDISKTMDTEKHVQNMKTNWKDEARELADRLELLEKEAVDLENYLKKQNLRLTLEEKKYEENLRRDKETARVKSELSGFLDRVLVSLEAGIAADLPFLAQERAGRIASLKEMMVDPEESPAEKFRRVFEALQIEAEYGTTIEVTQETISLGGRDILVDVFRLGRVSLLCQSLDQKKSAVFDPAAAQWQPLPESQNRDIAQAIAMARLERSIELVKLPLGKILK